MELSRHACSNPQTDSSLHVVVAAQSVDKIIQFIYFMGVSSGLPTTTTRDVLSAHELAFSIPTNPKRLTCVQVKRQDLLSAKKSSAKTLSCQEGFKRVAAPLSFGSSSFISSSKERGTRIAGMPKNAAVQVERAARIGVSCVFPKRRPRAEESLLPWPCRGA